MISCAYLALTLFGCTQTATLTLPAVTTVTTINNSFQTAQASSAMAAIPADGADLKPLVGQPENFRVQDASGNEDLPIEVAGWYNDGWDNESHAVYSKFNKIFSETNPYWYNLGTSDGGTAAEKSNGTIYERSYVYSAAKVNQIHANQDLVIPTIGDNGAGQINKIFNNAAARERLIDNLVNTAVKRNYDGFDLNFELGKPAGQAAFASFVDDLAKRLHEKGKRLSVTLKAADSARVEAREIFDYARLGQTAVDRFKIMMYDHNFDAGMNVPGPIGEYAWIENSLKYMIGRGLPAHKIQLGLHNYAWVWRQETNGSYTMMFPFSTYAAVGAQQTELKWDTTAREAWTDYSSNGQNYRAYVGDSRSVAERINLVHNYGLAGVTFWTLGREDERIYSNLPTQFAAQL